tara:strand:+ start:7603 stop:7791 length:189 start_codon:yes stop_codon:yes gene_type:complete
MIGETPKEFKVDHPEFGHVVFTGMTGRQMDILIAYQKTFDAQIKKPNNQEFGNVIRPLYKGK